MKKLAVAGAALTLVLTGCSNDADPVPSETPSPSQAPSSTPMETTAAPTDAPTSDDAGTSPESTATAERIPIEVPEDQLIDFTTGRSSSSDDPFNLEAQALPIAVRVGVHDDFDRVVVEYDTSAAPVEWVSPGWSDSATEEGSGREVNLGTERILQVQAWGIRIPDTDPVPDLTATIPQGSIVTSVRVDHAFEGGHQIYIGTADDHPYRVTRLADPERIVIDVRR